PSRSDTQERVATETLAALDGLEQVRGVAVVEPQEGADRRLEVGRTRGAEQNRVRVGGQAFGLIETDRICGCHRACLGESRTTFVPGTKGRAFRGATLIRRCRTLRDRRVERCRHRRRSALPGIAGALRRSLLARASPSWFG